MFPSSRVLQGTKECTTFGAGSNPFITLLPDVGGIIFPPGSSSFTGFVTYSSSTSFPINVGFKKIDSFEIIATCLIANQSQGVAPLCLYEVFLSFCGATPFDTPCNPSDPSYRNGSFFAAGAGPDPYDVNNGTGDYNDADGLIDSEIDTATFALGVSFIDICYDP